MLDLETWGTRPGSALRSVGAVVFDPKTGETGDSFYRNVTRASCLQYGLTVDQQTEKWWEDQDPAAIRGLEPDQRHLVEVLYDFRIWWAEVKGEFIWGHGASFDEVLLACAYRAVDVEPPWSFWNSRCCRTVLALGNRTVGRDRTGVHHNALDDAISQAKAVAATLRVGIKL